VRTPGAVRAGAALRAIRERRGLNRPQLAKLAGVSVGVLRLLELDRGGSPAALERLLVALRAREASTPPLPENPRTRGGR